MVISKKLSLALMMLTIISSTGYAKNEKEFKVLKKHAVEKRHISMSRVGWNHIKWSEGVVSALLSAVGTTDLALTYLGWKNAYPILTLLNGDDFISEVTPWKTLSYLLATTGLAYGGYKLIKNSYNSYRDEYVESYFGIDDPEQMHYRGEAAK